MRMGGSAMVVGGINAPERRQGYCSPLISARLIAICLYR